MRECERGRKNERMKTGNETKHKEQKVHCKHGTSIVNVYLRFEEGTTLSYYWIKTWTFYEQIY